MALQGILANLGKPVAPLVDAAQSATTTAPDVHPAILQLLARALAGKGAQGNMPPGIPAPPGKPITSDGHSTTDESLAAHNIMAPVGASAGVAAAGTMPPAVNAFTPTQPQANTQSPAQPIPGVMGQPVPTQQPQANAPVTPDALGSDATKAIVQGSGMSPVARMLQSAVAAKSQPQDTTPPAYSAHDNGQVTGGPVAPLYINAGARPTPDAMPQADHSIGQFLARLAAVGVGAALGGRSGALGAESGVVNAQDANEQRKMQEWQTGNAGKLANYEDALKQADAQNKFNQDSYGHQVTMADSAATSAAHSADVKLRVQELATAAADTATQRKIGGLQQQLAGTPDIEQAQAIQDKINGLTGLDIKLRGVDAQDPTKQGSINPSWKQYGQSQRNIGQAPTWAARAAELGAVADKLKTLTPLQGKQISAQTQLTLDNDGFIRDRTGAYVKSAEARAILDKALAGVVGQNADANTTRAGAAALNADINNAFLPYREDESIANTNYINTIKGRGGATDDPFGKEHYRLQNERNYNAANLEGASNQLNEWRKQNPGVPDDPTLAGTVHYFQGKVENYDNQMKAIQDGASAPAIVASNTPAPANLQASNNSLGFTLPDVNAPQSTQGTPYRPAPRVVTPTAPAPNRQLLNALSQAKAEQQQATAAGNALAAQYNDYTANPKKSHVPGAFEKLTADLNAANERTAAANDAVNKLNAQLPKNGNGRPSQRSQNGQQSRKAPDLSKFMLK